MNEQRHTPGPWAGGIASGMSTTGTTRLVMVVPRDYEVDSRNPQDPLRPEAMKRLKADMQIAMTAPDLLAACEAWVEYFDRLQRDTEPGDPIGRIRDQYHGKRLAQTRSAIASARAGHHEGTSK